MASSWPEFDLLLGKLHPTPVRTGSLIVSVFGDAIMPRGGALAMTDLLTLMARLGIGPGVVRTAISRLARDGILEGRRFGRRSAYALTDTARAAFTAAVPRIYRATDSRWGDTLTLVFPATPEQRAEAEATGFAALSPGVAIAPLAAPPGLLWIGAAGPASAQQALVAKAWPLAAIAGLYRSFVADFGALTVPPGIAGIDALAARIMAVHSYRRITLRDPHLPPGFLPPDWSGVAAAEQFARLYSSLAPAAEEFLDTLSNGSSLLPKGPDPCARLTADGRPLSERAW